MAQALARRGVGPKAVRPAHLARLYAAQRPGRTPRRTQTPDFATVQPILDRLAVATPEARPWAAIVETRAEARLEFVIRNVHAELGLPVVLFHGASNRAMAVEAMGDLLDAGVLQLTELGLDQLPAPLYNALLLSPPFWHAIPAQDRVVVFQTDSMVCPDREFSLDDFADLELVGSSWPVARPLGFEIWGGNGGFSLRSKPRLLECLRRFPPAPWLGGEDAYFGLHCELMGARVASPDECSRFAAQFDFRYRTLGAHKIHMLAPGDLSAFLDYCPSARVLLPDARTDPRPESGQ